MQPQITERMSETEDHGMLQINVPGMLGTDITTRLETFLGMLNSYDEVLMTVYVNGHVKDVLVSWNSGQGRFTFEEKVYP